MSLQEIARDIIGFVTTVSAFILCYAIFGTEIWILSLAVVYNSAPQFVPVLAIPLFFAAIIVDIKMNRWLCVEGILL